MNWLKFKRNYYQNRWFAVMDLAENYAYNFKETKNLDKYMRFELRKYLIDLILRMLWFYFKKDFKKLTKKVK